jgi:glycosyltransferase involved in cell wall biosynthesis
MKILIDPRCKINYASFYLKGIFEIFDNVCFTSKSFDDMLFKDRNDYRRGMCIIINENIQQRKVYIDFGDSNTISLKHYEWADVYAKINLKKEDSIKYPKSIAIGTSFGINILNLGFVLKLFSSLFSVKHKPVKIKEYINDYVYLLIRRKKYEAYLCSKSESKDDYVFAISTLWPYKNEIETTNKIRGLFIRQCQKIFSSFEGGFFYIKNGNKIFPEYEKYVEEYKGLLYTKRITSTEYISKTKKSCIVFNTPAVSGYLGWKLGEYFAMGKAIISTHLNNVIPYTDNIPLLIVDDLNDLADAIARLKNDNKLRKKMEEESRQYFNNYLAPKIVIKRIIRKLNIQI